MKFDERTVKTKIPRYFGINAIFYTMPALLENSSHLSDFYTYCN